MKEHTCQNVRCMMSCVQSSITHKIDLQLKYQAAMTTRKDTDDFKSNM